jgi:hypothetical protein
MAKLNIWTVDEYYSEMKKYFSDQQDNRVIKIIAPGSISGGYHYWVRPNLMPFDKQIDIWWNYEPLMRRYFDTKEELAKNLNPDCKNAHGFSLRWLFHDEVVYQISPILGDVNSCINKLRTAQSGEYLMGFKMDPFTYTGKIPLKKESNGQEYIDDKGTDLKVERNYRVFWEEITPKQFLEEEKLYTDENTHSKYHDDLLKEGSKMKKATVEFFKKHTDFKYN